MTIDEHVRSSKCEAGCQFRSAAVRLDAAGLNPSFYRQSRCTKTSDTRPHARERIAPAAPWSRVVAVLACLTLATAAAEPRSGVGMVSFGVPASARFVYGGRRGSIRNQSVESEFSNVRLYATKA